MRRAGAGRPRLTQGDPGLVAALEALVDPVTRGGPQSPLRWTCKSTRTLADALGEAGHAVSSWTVTKLLHELGYSPQANVKVREGAAHPDRDAQLRYLGAQVQAQLGEGGPVVSVDTKKKELSLNRLSPSAGVGANEQRGPVEGLLTGARRAAPSSEGRLMVGNHKNGGRDWQPKGEPVEVNTHDFPGEAGKAIPYGIYDVAADTGWVAVGKDHDTAAFAVATLRRWWDGMGAAAYPDARRLLICAADGGSNSSRGRLWKAELGVLARDTGLAVTVCHLPPGTSRWNKIEHRLFAHISMSWRGRPLESHEVVVQLIAATTTRSGLRVHAELDEGAYPKGVKISDEDMAALALHKHAFHGDWNYTLHPEPIITAM